MIGFGQLNDSRYIYLNSGINISNANYDDVIEMTTVDLPDGTGEVINAKSMLAMCFSIGTYFYEKNSFSLGVNIGYADKGFSFGSTKTRYGEEYELVHYASFLSLSPSFRYNIVSNPLDVFIAIDPQLDFRLKNGIKINGEYPYEQPNPIYNFGELYTGVKVGVGATKKISNLYLIGLQYNYWHNISGTLSFDSQIISYPKEDPKSYSMNIMLTFGLLLDAFETE